MKQILTRIPRRTNDILIENVYTFTRTELQEDITKQYIKTISRPLTKHKEQRDKTTTKTEAQDTQHLKADVCKLRVMR